MPPKSCPTMPRRAPVHVRTSHEKVQARLEAGDLSPDLGGIGSRAVRIDGPREAALGQDARPRPPSASSAASSRYWVRLPSGASLSSQCHMTSPGPGDCGLCPAAGRGMPRRRAHPDPEDEIVHERIGAGAARGATDLRTPDPWQSCHCRTGRRPLERLDQNGALESRHDKQPCIQGHAPLLDLEQGRSQIEGASPHDRRVLHRAPRGAGGRPHRRHRGGVPGQDQPARRAARHLGGRRGGPVALDRGRRRRRRDGRQAAAGRPGGHRGP